MKRRDRLKKNRDKGVYVPDKCGPTGKVRYSSAAKAEEALSAVRERDPNGSLDSGRVYSCNVLCGGWHLTKQESHKYLRDTMMEEWEEDIG